MKHVLSIIVENKTGVLSRISGLFTRRGYNIESLAVGETDDPSISRMTIIVDEDEETIEQVSKQLYKLIEVIKLVDLTDVPSINRELILIKVNVSPETRTEIIELVDIFRARIIDVSENSFVIEATGDEEKILALENMLRKYGIKEVSRTGTIALSRG